MGELVGNNFPAEEEEMFSPPSPFLVGVLGCEDVMLGTAATLGTMRGEIMLRIFEPLSPDFLLYEKIDCLYF